MQLLNVGHGNTVVLERITAVINTGSSPARKLKEIAKNENRLLDVTEGRRTRSILILDTNHVVLSSVQTDTIGQRIAQLQQGTQIELLAAEGRVAAVKKGEE